MALYKVICAATLLTLLTQESHSQLDVCGRPPLNTKIVGGQEASAGSWPWLVDLRFSEVHLCGGSLINNQWVLTSAQCCSSEGVGPDNLTVVLGLQNQQGSGSSQVSQTVTQIIVNPNHISGSFDNDICLVKLSSPVNFTNYIQPVCLAAQGSTFYNGTDSWLSGWGDTATNVSSNSPGNLTELELLILGNRQCNCSFGRGLLTSNMICAGLNAGGQVSCQGDLGGPLVSKQGGRWIQEGIVTLGNDCTGPNFPALFARVSQYQSWINSQITSNQPGFLTFMSNGTDSDLSFTCPVPPPTTTAPPVVCGQAPLNSRILGGSSVATAGVWPSMASLRNNGSHVCGGTLVALDFVLSDANCFSSSPIASEWTVVLGRLNQNGSNPFEVTLKVTNITLSNFTGSNVAVLRLATRPTLSNHIQPICLDNGQTFTVGSTCWAAGWSAGQGGVLQEVQTSVVNCGNASTSDSICTSSFTLAQGDAGGPMMCKLGGSWFQAAVLSVQNNSTSQTRADPVMVFTKLSRFQTFLAQILGTFLSPASTSSSTAATTTPTTSGGAPAHSPIFFFHLLIFSVCLHVFS